MASGGSRSGAGRKRNSPALAMTPAERAKLPATPAASLIAPLHLSDLAQLLFADIAGMLEAQGRAEPQFAQIVALLAQRLEQIQRWQAVLEMTGDTCTSTTVRKVDGKQVITEMTRARPEVAMLSEAMRHAQSLLGELMLSPSAAMKLGGGKRDGPGEFDDF
ncbi:P27 family phage terminase small subunit [uncultured Sphingomonas sp.]|uniref:P27 family phage terminase small subunit n=1 Tax=uncultured Sphingomonas sp. TaxID=158754 RepID=UPI00258ED81E|nr:P27 family phage terminase small subunit [uncultured Sphingomonas sp.]